MSGEPAAFMNAAATTVFKLQVGGGGVGDEEARTAVPIAVDVLVAVIKLPDKEVTVAVTEGVPVWLPAPVELLETVPVELDDAIVPLQVPVAVDEMLGDVIVDALSDGVADGGTLDGDGVLVPLVAVAENKIAPAPFDDEFS